MADRAGQLIAYTQRQVGAFRNLNLAEKPRHEFVSLTFKSEAKLSTICHIGFKTLYLATQHYSLSLFSLTYTSTAQNNTIVFCEGQTRSLLTHINLPFFTLRNYSREAQLLSHKRWQKFGVRISGNKNIN